ncbi:MAG TPA: L-aspartate oxidase, partial [Roseiflexaceae bacterium]|nr:L-aspartate oxidase [Roseiflexaceae bacterium]
MLFRPLLQDIAVDAPRYVLSNLHGQTWRHAADVLVVGGGAAGLAAALCAAEAAEVILLSRAALLENNSAWAQGGIAAALDADDSPLAHIEDTLTAGAGLSDLAAAEALAEAAPALMRELAALGVPFERTDYSFALGLEGGHSRRRIVHVGDATGWALTSALTERARAHPRIQILEGYQAVDLLDDDGRCTGVLARDGAGEWHRLDAPATILATGGAGALFGLTSNQPGALGEGIALAYRAGAAVADLEFVQFHPTVLRTRAGHGFLISEALRGEGARLLTTDGRRFMPAYDPRAELAPRDVVARGIFAAMHRAGADHVLLDMTHMAARELQRRFPTIEARCRAEGYDLATTPIPVAPAAHYLIGGIRTDLHGATNLPGLYAAGECACTGVHGANRLASNSLLECLVFGRRAGAAATRQIEHATLRIEKRLIRTRLSQHSMLNSQFSWRDELANLMTTHAGLARSRTGLAAALDRLNAFALQADDPEAITAANA